jgi:hypothetical protein
MKRITAFFVFSYFLAAIIPATANSESPWPHPVPCRIHDGANPDLFVMTLGDVRTPIADGIFDPVKDEVTLNGGDVMTNYFRDTLGVKFYQPLDKKNFPLPPSGWCSWYYYYNRPNETEIKRNADWIAANLKDFGAQVVQIDDGWQGSGGRDGQRDWTHVSPTNFPGGMAKLAAHIKSLGLTPGLWLAPHGQSNPEFVTNHPDIFLHRADGSLDLDQSRWEGRYLVDATAPQSRDYMRDLFAKLSSWGFDYFKIDGQPTVVDEYERKKQFLKNPAADPVVAYRNSLESIRNAIGPNRYLLGCWGTPLEGAGIMNGSRTGGDVVLGWGGFHVALRPTMQFYFLHNIVWYSDPDVLLVRSPLTMDQARVWATLEGLTGQALMSSDRLMDLSDERVELLRRVYPATDIRPLDLFPGERDKRIWDLKISHLGRDYDVVGVFNFDTDKSAQIFLRWSDLGVATNKPVHVFDFWNKEYLGAWSGGMAVPLSPTSCRVLTLLPDDGNIQLISTSRHITQGWVDLVNSKLETQNPGIVFSGTSKVVKNDPYELRFAFPRGTNFMIRRAVARLGSKALPIKISNHQGWATLEFTSPNSAEVNWKIQFEPADIYHFPPSAPEGLAVKRLGLDGVELSWREQYYLNAGYEVYLNGALLGYTPEARFAIHGVAPNSNYTAQVKTVWEDGRESPRRAEANFNLASMVPKKLSLTELEPLRFTGRWRGFEADEMLSSAQLTLGSDRFDHALISFAGSEIEFNVKGIYDRFTALAGLDAASDENASVEFFILGDGKELWRSGELKKSDAPKTADVNIAGVQKLILRSTREPDRRIRAQAGWAEPTVFK